MTTPSSSDRVVARQASEHATLPVSGVVSTALCAGLGIVAAALHPAPGSGGAAAVQLVWLAAYVAGGWETALNAWAALRQGQLNVDLLMLAAAVGAAVIGDWTEGAVLLFLFSLSGTLEAFAMYRTHRSIESLIRLRPREAWLVASGQSEDLRVAVDDLQLGARVRVKPGERFPVDGEVEEGETWADESTLTGESDRIHKVAGDSVFAGTINGTGSVVVRTTKHVADTTLARIVHMVQEAQAHKTPSQRFVESWQRPYVLGVFAASAVVLLASRIIHTADWYDAFYHAMVLLVAASPCAVVVSSPAVMLSTIARAGLHGVLFKGAVHVESLGRVDVMAFDKTGTVTVGKPGVTEVWASGGADANRLLALAASVERRSEHPLAASVLDEAHRRGVPLSERPLLEFHSHTGLGVHARVEGVWVGVGREGLFDTHEIALPADVLDRAQRMRAAGETALLVAAAEEQLFGIIGVADQIRPEAAKTIAALKRLELRQIVVLTGDHEHVARAIAAQLHADDVRAGLLPDQKVVELRRLAKAGGVVAMIGDGVNDAPALAAATVGIAMGGAGTDVALEVADVVLMRDDLRALPFAVWISRVACRRVRHNMIFAFTMIGILLLGSFFGMPLWLGVLGHEGSTVLVVFNGLRILWERLPAS